MAFKLLKYTAIAVLIEAVLVSGGSLTDIEHVVIFMQENRSWDTVRFPCVMNRSLRTHYIAVLWHYARSPGLQ